MGLFLFVLVVLLLIYVFKGIIIVQQQEEVIIERLGRYERTLKAGPNFIFPILDAPRGIAKKVTQRTVDGHTYSYLKETSKIDLRETVYDFPRQNVITKDNVSITINALLYFQIIDAKSAVYEIANLPEAIEKRALPPIAFLNYTYTNKDKINYSFSNQERHIEDQIFNVKETINDRFLDTQYDVFFKKKSDSSLTGFIFESKGTRSISLTPTFFMEINSIENNRDCFLDINFKPTDPKFENFTFNLKENYDTSIQFTLLNNQDEFFKCKLEHKDEYNLFTLSWRGLEDNILFKIYNKNI